MTQKYHPEDNLKQLLKEVTQNELANQSTQKDSIKDLVEVDVLHLPPRKEVFQDQKADFKIHFRSFTLRFTAIIVMTLLIFTTGFLFFGEVLMQLFE